MAARAAASSSVSPSPYRRRRRGAAGVRTTRGRLAQATQWRTCTQRTRQVCHASSPPVPASPASEDGVASDGTRVPEGHRSLHDELYGRGGAVVEHGDAKAATTKEVFEREVASLFDGGAAPLRLVEAIDKIEAVRAKNATAAASVCGIYGLYMANDDGSYTLAFVGFSRNLLPSIKAHQEAFTAFTRSRDHDAAANRLYVRLRVWDAKSKGMPTREKFMAEKRRWLAARGDVPPNEVFEAYWAHLSGDEDSGEISMRRANELGAMSDDERNMYEDKKAKLQKAMGENSHANETPEEREKRVREKMMRNAVDESDWSAVINEQTAETVDIESAVDADSDAGRHTGGEPGAAVVSPFASEVAEATHGHDNTASRVVMTPASVHEALEAVRPYLIADGGDVEVVSVRNDDGVVVLRLQGACGSCPSSSTTMKMGIERVLKEHFGDALKEVLQADESGALVSQDVVTVALVDAHLDTLRPAIVNYGGEVRVLELSDTSVTISYTGPPPILVGIKAAIKDKFPSIQTVVEM